MLQRACSRQHLHRLLAITPLDATTTTEQMHGAFAIDRKRRPVETATRQQPQQSRLPCIQMRLHSIAIKFDLLEPL